MQMSLPNPFKRMAGTTGLEPAASIPYKLLCDFAVMFISLGR
jgi:hypothetical protein